MLLPAQRVIGTPILSLQTGGQLAKTKTVIIDPRDLTIIAFELEGHLLDDNPSFLLIDDIRELSNIGIIVDSNEEFVGENDVIKLKEVYDFHFELTGKLVRDPKMRKLGKVISYSLEPNSFIIKQLTVKRPILKSLSDTELLIDRTQIVEVSNVAITIDNDEREPVPVAKRAASSFSNPFRGQSAQPETTNSH